MKTRDLLGIDLGGKHDPGSYRGRAPRSIPIIVCKIKKGQRLNIVGRAGRGTDEGEIAEDEDLRLRPAR